MPVTFTEEQAHAASRVAEVQWHRLDHSPESDLDEAAVLLGALEREMQERAQEILALYRLTDWAVSLHIGSVRT